MKNDFTNSVIICNSLLYRVSTKKQNANSALNLTIFHYIYFQIKIHFTQKKQQHQNTYLHQFIRALKTGVYLLFRGLFAIIYLLFIRVAIHKMTFYPFCMCYELLRSYQCSHIIQILDSRIRPIKKLSLEFSETFVQILNFTIPKQF